MYQEEKATSGRAAMTAASSGDKSFIWMCQFPYWEMAFTFWARISMSAMPKIAVTRKTARIMHRMVMRFCFL